MPFEPTGIAALALYPGIADTTAFTFFQVNQSGQLDMFLARVTGEPQLIFSTVPQPANTNVKYITGDAGSFSVNSGRLTVIDQDLIGTWGGIAQSGQTNLGWFGVTDVEAGLTVQSYIDVGKPQFRIRNGDETGFNGEYSMYFGNSMKIRRNDGSFQTFSVPTGKMALFVGNSYTDETCGFARIGASSRAAEVADNNNIVGTAFCSWDGLGTLYKNLSITPSYVEMGGPSYYDFEEIGGVGAVIIRQSASPPTIGALYGLTLYSTTDPYIEESNLSIVNRSGRVSELYPAIKNTNGITLSPEAYVPITSTRSITDADAGKILYTSTGNYLLTVPNTLTLPFQCSIKCEGTGKITFTGGGGTLVRNAYGRYKTAGQYTVCGLDWRSGTTCVLFGDTDL